jgi:hypothetical protein
MARTSMCVLRLALVAGFFAGCAFDEGEGEDEPGDEQVGEIDQAVTTEVADDFEGHPLGALGAPWEITPAGSASRAIVVDTGSIHGRALLLDGSTGLGDYLIASLGFSSSATLIRSRVSVNRAAGSTFIYSLHGAGSSIGRRRIRLQLDPGTSMLSSQTVPSGTVECGAVPAGKWNRIQLIVHARQWPHTFDVRINGEATACTGIECGLSPPFNAVSVMDPSNEGWGGEVLFDDVLVTTP